MPRLERAARVDPRTTHLVQRPVQGKLPWSVCSGGSTRLPTMRRLGAVPHHAAPQPRPQPQPRFAHRVGALGVGNDVHTGLFTVAEAKQHCAAINAVGFTFCATGAYPTGKVNCFFKSSADGNTDPQWQTFLRAGHAQPLATTTSGSGSGGGAAVDTPAYLQQRHRSAAAARTAAASEHAARRGVEINLAREQRRAQAQEEALRQAQAQVRHQMAQITALPQQEPEPEPEPEPAHVPDAAEYARFGISVEGLLYAAQRFGVAIGPPVYTHRVGALAAGGDIGAGEFTLAEAKEHCATLRAAGFTFQSSSTEPSGKLYCYFKDKSAGVANLQWQTYLAAPTNSVTTSDICHRYIKPETLPTGWVDEATLTDAEKRWYSHSYVDTVSRTRQDAPPPGTRSYCELLLADPATRHFVGRPTHFLSHAWLYRFANLVEALKAFVAAQPPGSPPVFFWYDCFCIDEHRTQTLPDEWWSTTFKEAIRLIGSTVMMLSPW